MNHLANPNALWMLVVVGCVAALLAVRPRRGRVVYSSLATIRGVARTWRTRLRFVPPLARVLALAAIVVALARPQETSGKTRTSTEGVAIQIVLDRSRSMLEGIDIGGRQATKLSVVQRVLSDFVNGDEKQLKGRTGDMIGLITFARYADTLAPLSRTHEALVTAANRVKVAETVSEGGTAIGEGLALAAARLKRAEEEIARSAPKDGKKPDFTIKSKVIVLLTDGENNQGSVSPNEAAKLAAAWGIKVYAIGVGAGPRFTTVQTAFGAQRVPTGGSDVDERTLKAIAEATGGRYFAAESADSLRQASTEIDRLEKSKIETDEYTQATERFGPFAMAALGLVLCELLLSATVLRRSP